jgi:ankyrin repeat protein
VVSVSADVNSDLFEAIASEDAAKVKKLLDAGADVNGYMMVDIGSSAMAVSHAVTRTPLMAASAVGNTEIAEILIDAGADLDAQMRGGSLSMGETVLIDAINQGMLIGNTDCVELLIKKGADVNKPSDGGDVPLSHTIPDIRGIAATEWEMRLEIAGLLIEAGADLNRQNLSGNTPLMIAASKGYEPFVELMLKSELDKQDGFGRTALIKAADKGHSEVVKMLVEAGANLNIKDRFGYTALELAKDKGRTAVAEVLTAAGAR